jgi:hypothetical protein
MVADVIGADGGRDPSPTPGVEVWGMRAETDEHDDSRAHHH